jgi:hypothetical protein
LIAASFALDYGVSIYAAPGTSTGRPRQHGPSHP